jgi:hypothetical protein
MTATYRLAGNGRAGTSEGVSAQICQTDIQSFANQTEQSTQ